MWDSIDHAQRGVSPAVAVLVEERLAEADENPLDGRSWDEIKAGWQSQRR